MDDWTRGGGGCMHYLCLWFLCALGTERYTPDTLSHTLKDKYSGRYATGERKGIFRV